jgi:hypothetical protein
MPNGRRIGSRGMSLISENVRTNRQSTSAEALSARMRRDRRPLQNPVTPFGDVVAISQRGLYIGNRGIIHDPATKTLLGRRWTTKAWLVCVLDYKGRRRELMGGRSWSGSFSMKLWRLPPVTGRASSAAAPMLKHFKPTNATRGSTGHRRKKGFSQRRPGSAVPHTH